MVRAAETFQQLETRVDVNRLTAELRAAETSEQRMARRVENRLRTIESRAIKTHQQHEAWLENDQ